jgi:hypothetical protein
VTERDIGAPPTAGLWRVSPQQSSWCCAWRVKGCVDQCKGNLRKKVGPTKGWKRHHLALSRKRAIRSAHDREARPHILGKCPDNQCRFPDVISLLRPLSATPLPFLICPPAFHPSRSRLPGQSLRLHPHPSCVACPDRTAPRSAWLRGAPAGCHGALGRGNRRGRGVAAGEAC